MPLTDLSERNILGSGLLALGCSFGGVTAALFVVAFDHMAASATMCGASPGHCVACIGALVALAAALGISGSGLSLLHPFGPTGMVRRHRPGQREPCKLPS